MERRAVDGNGNDINPSEFVVPIIKETEPEFLQIVGTGFYIIRYGLVLTAQHVVEPLINPTGRELGTGFILHWAGKEKCYLRRILGASYLNEVDLAIIQPENYMDRFPDNPLVNRRVPLSLVIPIAGSEVITYAYPENEEIDFSKEGNSGEVKADYYEGKFCRVIEAKENPFLPYAHLETTIHLKSGASGGPVYDNQRKVIGVNCSGMDFLETEQKIESLSRIVPIEYLLSLSLEPIQLPPGSWEEQQIPESRRGGSFSIKDLADFGHISLSPMWE